MGDSEDIQQLEDAATLLEMEAIHRGWQRRWTWDFTARYFLVERNYCRLVYAALDRRWPGVARRQVHDPRALSG